MQGKVALQGNLDPATLYGSPDAIRSAVRQALDSYRDGNGGSREGHVFNLGHGMSPDMNPDHVAVLVDEVHAYRSEEHTSELQSLMRLSYAVFCLKKKTNITILRQ